MLDDLREKIEDAQSRLVRLGTDINRMKEVEEAFADTDQRFADTANRVTRLTDVTQAAHHSLNEASTSLTNVARALDRIDAQTLLTAIDNQGSVVVDEVRSGNASLESSIERSTKAARVDRRENTDRTTQKMESVGVQVTDAVTAGGEAILNQVKDATTELDATTRTTVAPVKWVGVLTLLTSIAVLVIAVLIFLNN